MMEGSRSWHEPVVGVLGVNSCLEGPAVQLDVVLSHAELFTGGDLLKDWNKKSLFGKHLNRKAFDFKNAFILRKCLKK